MKSSSVKIGIALGGGGARGLAHVGVLKVLEQEGIPLHCVTGTSMGAIVGAMYAQNPNADLLIERIKQSADKDLYDQLSLDYLQINGLRDKSFIKHATQKIKRRIALNLAQSRDSIFNQFHLKSILLKFLDEGNIEDTEIPLGIVATSLHTGDDIVFKEGDILTAVVASSSIPGFLCPVCFNDDLLTDGGVSCPVPVRFVSEMGSDVTIGVEICMRKYHPLETVNVIEIINRADTITSRNLARMMVNTADVAICPDTKDVHWADFSRVDELIEVGIKSAQEKVPEIRKAIQRKGPWYRRILLGLSGALPLGGLDPPELDFTAKPLETT